MTGEVIDLGLVRLHLMELGPQHGPTGRVVALANSVVFQASGGVFKQIPGVSLVWRELSLTIPADADYAAIKERLLRAAGSRARELPRRSRAADARAAEDIGVERRREGEAQVQLRFSSDSIEAIVRYPVPLQRAAEVEERMSRALLDAIRERAAGRRSSPCNPRSRSAGLIPASRARRAVPSSARRARRRSAAEGPGAVALTPCDVQFRFGCALASAHTKSSCVKRRSRSRAVSAENHSGFGAP